MTLKMLGPIVMWRGIVVSLALLVVMSFFAGIANASPVVFGTFDGDDYVYDPDSVRHADNIAIVSVATSAEKFNYGHNKDYGGSAGLFYLDCSEHTAALVDGTIVNTSGKILQRAAIPKVMRVFSAIKQDTLQDALYRAICAKHPVM